MLKLKRTRLSLLVVMLMLSAQLSVAPPAARAAQDANSSTMTMQGNHGQHMGIPTSRCRRRCSSAYRLCLRRGRSRGACARQLRNCQRRCPQ